MQLNSCTTVTETTSILPPSVDMDTLKEAEQTIERRMLIRAVLHPCTGQHVTLDTALRDGIVDYEKGCYLNPKNGELLSIDQAISEGKIQVEFVAIRASQEKRQNSGIVTVKVDEAKNVSQTFVVTSVLDRSRNLLLSFDEAVERGVLLLDKTLFVDTMTQETLLIPAALDKGFLLGKRVEDPAAAVGESRFK